MSIDVKKITEDNCEALALPNDPFYNTGKLIPMYDGERWDYRIEYFPEDKVTKDCFPDEHYVFAEMDENYFGLAAYCDGRCAGFALFAKSWEPYLYLDNLLVVGECRKQGVGSALMREGMKLVKELGKAGIKLVCQDNNLGAAQFYLANGFELGGMDSRVYDTTKQEGKTDLFFYKKAEEV